jgi:hypothetical protein
MTDESMGLTVHYSSGTLRPEDFKTHDEVLALNRIQKSGGLVKSDILFYEFDAEGKWSAHSSDVSIF